MPTADRYFRVHLIHLIGQWINNRIMLYPFPGHQYVKVVVVREEVPGVVGRRWRSGPIPSDAHHHSHQADARRPRPTSMCPLLLLVSFLLVVVDDRL